MVKRLSGILILVGLFILPAPPKNELHVLDVGQGDSILLTTDQGHAMLVDGGPDGSVMMELAARLIQPEIDLMVMTHYDADHVTGFIAVLKAYQVKEIWIPPLAPTTMTGKELLVLAESEGAVVRTPSAGEHIQLDDFSIQVLSPDFSKPKSTDSATNDQAFILGVSLGKADVMLTADAPTERILQAWQAWTTVSQPLEIYKVGHHGSHTSTTPALVNTILPQQAVISVGAKNRYGHPTAETIEDFSADHIPIWRTDQQGSFDMLLKADGSTAIDYRLPGILSWIAEWLS